MNVFFEQFFDFGIMGDNLDLLLKGFWFTVKLSVIGGVASLIWGLVLALFRQLPGRALAPVRGLTIAYIDVFRGIPLLMSLLMINATLPAFGNEGVLPGWLADPNWLGQPQIFWYGILGLTITYGAYMAEVYRAGIEAVPNGQTEAARSLGMSHGQSMRYVVVPQAVGKMIPPLLNDFIALMKDTTLVSVLGLIEVLQAGQDIQQETFNASGYTVGALLFVLVTIPLARLADRLIAGQQAKYQRGLVRV
jgi:polar amino acid transport system permease protein